MATSEARKIANKINAQKSTGPRTEEGKARSSRNAITHGFTSTVALHPDDQEKVELRTAQWNEDFQADTDFELSMIATAAKAFTIQERAELTEAQLTRQRLDHWKDARLHEIDCQIIQLEKEIRQWDAIRDDLFSTDGEGFGVYYKTMLCLVGSTPKKAPTDLNGLELERFHIQTSFTDEDRRVLQEHAKGNASKLTKAEYDAFNSRAQRRAKYREQACQCLARHRALAVANLQLLNERRQRCEHATPPPDAWMDFSKEAQLRQRYAKEASREFHKKTRELETYRRQRARLAREARAEAAEATEVVAIHEVEVDEQPQRNEPNAPVSTRRNEANAPIGEEVSLVESEGLERLREQPEPLAAFKSRTGIRNAS